MNKQIQKWFFRQNVKRKKERKEKIKEFDLKSVVVALELQEADAEATELGKGNLVAIIGPTPKHRGRAVPGAFQLQNLSLKFVAFRLRVEFFIDGSD